MGTLGWPPGSPTSSGGMARHKHPPFPPCPRYRVPESPSIQVPTEFTLLPSPVLPNPRETPAHGHPQVPPSLCTHTSIPLRSQSLGTHICWHPSGAPHLRAPAPPAVCVPRSPVPGCPGPRSPPRIPHRAEAAVPLRDALRSALPALPPARRAGSCSPAQHPRAPASGNNPLRPQKPRRGCSRAAPAARLLLKSSLSSGRAAHPAPLGRDSTPEFGDPRRGAAARHGCLEGAGSSSSTGNEVFHAKKA